MKGNLVFGAGGFIGGHLCRRIRDQYQGVYGFDIKPLEEWYQVAYAHTTMQCDLSRQDSFAPLIGLCNYGRAYQLGADMGGMGYIGGDHDAGLMTNSALINLNVLNALVKFGFKGKVFYSSSACVYNDSLQTDPNNPGLKESDAYPADPKSGYGWEKLFSEQLYDAYRRNHGLDIRIGRFHNVYGPNGTYDGGREKAPAAICRKVAQTPDGGEIEIWGDGEQTRSFLYVDDCLDGVEALMNSDCHEPRNIGSTEMVTINQLAEMAIEISGKKLSIRHVDGPTGVRGRNSDNTLMKQTTGWDPKWSLRQGMEVTYKWIAEQIAK